MSQWVEGAIRQDLFKVRAEHNPTNDERHSVSVIDIFQSFNQAVKQVVQLHWEDEYQFAKFMTALMKTISAGVIRYCEQIEQFFIKEMDRMTPEQEVVMNQTRQERWVRLAKDALNARERASPFQFLPEVCKYVANFMGPLLTLC